MKSINRPCLLPVGALFTPKVPNPATAAKKVREELENPFFAIALRDEDKIVFASNFFKPGGSDNVVHLTKAGITLLFDGRKMFDSKSVGEHLQELDPLLIRASVPAALEHLAERLYPRLEDDDIINVLAARGLDVYSCDIQKKGLVLHVPLVSIWCTANLKPAIDSFTEGSLKPKLSSFSLSDMKDLAKRIIEFQTAYHRSAYKELIADSLIQVFITNADGTVDTCI